MWGAVRRLKEIGLDVVCVVADGAKPNRKFCRDHAHEYGMKDGVVYKARNIFEPSKWIYFISDIPRSSYKDYKKLSGKFSCRRNTAYVGKPKFRIFYCPSAFIIHVRYLICGF